MSEFYVISHKNNYLAVSAKSKTVISTSYMTFRSYFFIGNNMAIANENKKLVIIYKKRDELAKQDHNSRTHTYEQIKQIAESIVEFGWTNPVLIDENDNIIAGHGRVLAAEFDNIEEIPCIVLVGLTNQQKRAYLIADNKLALNANWNFEILNAEMQKLIDSDFNVDLLGFSDKELEDLLSLGDVDTSKVDEFKEYDEQELAHKCPRCGFEYD